MDDFSSIQSLIWIPAFAGMTKCGVFFSIEPARRLLWMFERMASRFVIPAKAGIQIKLLHKLSEISKIFILQTTI